jgi:tetratricopeptide (TPR) repeat protein
MRLGQYALALEQFGQSLALKKTNNDITGQAFALFYLGLTSLYVGQDDEAEQYLNASLAMWQQVSFNERGLAYVEQGMGLLALYRGQYAQAESCLRSAVARCEKLVLKAEWVENLSHLSQAVLGQGNLEGARQLTDQAIQLLERQKDVEEEQSIYFNHYRVLQAQCDPQAGAWKERASATVTQQADRIQEAGLKQVFLEQVRINQQIAA